MGEVSIIGLDLAKNVFQANGATADGSVVFRGRFSRGQLVGQRDIRRLLIIGSVAVVRWAARKGAPEGSRVARMMARKPRMPVAVALANREPVAQMRRYAAESASRTAWWY